MGTIALRAHGSLSVQLAWERYARPSEWPAWAPQISSVDADADRIDVGVRGVVHGPLWVRVPFVVTAVDEAARTWSWEARLGPVSLALEHALIDVEAGTRATLRISGPAPVVVAYAPVAALALTRLVRGPDQEG